MLAGMTARRLLTVLAVVCAGCEKSEEPTGQSSVTVRLPPPRPAIAEPGFSSVVPDNSALARPVL